MRLALALLVVAVPVLAAAEPQQLPKKCAADSPVDDPCTSYGGTYKISIRQRDGEKRCLTKKKAATALVKVDGSRKHTGQRQATELAAFARALGFPKSDLLLGADVRDGVCCVDLEVSPKGRDAHVRVRLARGKSIVSAKAMERDMRGVHECDADLDVTVEVVGK